MQNFMMTDLAGGAAATVVFSLFLAGPGYVVGWTFNAFRFRSRSETERLLVSVALSVAISPVLAVLIGRYLSPATSLRVFFLLSVASIVLCVARMWKTPKPGGSTAMARDLNALLGVVLFAAWVLFELSDLQIGHSLYLSVTSYDECVRVAFVQAAVRTGVPPSNPFYYAGHTTPLRYFYYWYALCALPMRALGVTARASLAASSVWSGLALAAMVPLYLKHFFGETRKLRSRTVVGIALFLVTGLDIIPTLILAAGSPPRVYADMEWWNGTQVTSWLDSILWVPHHVASLVACLTGFLLLWSVRESTNWRDRAPVATLAAMAFASATGLSLYVTFPFAIFLVAWSAVLLVAKKFALVLTYAASGAGALLLSLPYLRDLSGPGTSERGFAILTLRTYPPAMDWLQAAGVHSPLLLGAAKLPILVVVLAIEFGFFGFVLIARFRRDYRNRNSLDAATQASWLMLACSLYVACCFRSGVFGTNDLAMRAALVAQFVLLMWAIPMVRNLAVGRNWASFGFRWRNGNARTVTILLTLGLVASVYQVAVLRLYAPLVEKGTISRSEDWLPENLYDLGPRTYALRAGYAELDRMVSPDAIVQHNPATLGYVPFLLYSRYQAVAAVPGCNTVFGGDPAKCAPLYSELHDLYLRPARGADLDELCDRMSIDVLVASDLDRAWADKKSWVWTTEPLVANPYLRAIPCGSHQRVRRIIHAGADPGSE